MDRIERGVSAEYTGRDTGVRFGVGWVSCTERPSERASVSLHMSNTQPTAL